MSKENPEVTEALRKLLTRFTPETWQVFQRRYLSNDEDMKRLASLLSVLMTEEQAVQRLIVVKEETKKGADKNAGSGILEKPVPQSTVNLVKTWNFQTPFDITASAKYLQNPFLNLWIYPNNVNKDEEVVTYEGLVSVAKVPIGSLLNDSTRTHIETKLKKVISSNETYAGREKAVEDIKETFDKLQWSTGEYMVIYDLNRLLTLREGYLAVQAHYLLRHILEKKHIALCLPLIGLFFTTNIQNHRNTEIQDPRSVGIDTFRFEDVHTHSDS